MLRKAVFSSPLLAAAAVKDVSGEKGYVHTYDGAAKKDPKVKQLIYRPSDLPLYIPLETSSSSDPHKKGEIKPSPVVETIEGGFRAVRVSLQGVSQAVADQKHQLTDIIETGKAHTQGLRDYLNEEDNTVPRIGAVAVGGLAGLIFGLRGGFFKRLVYTSIGAGGVASICYPKEAKIYTEQALVETRKYGNIGYNFVYGVKPGDPNQKQLPNLPIPTNVEELKTSLSDLGKSAYDAVFSSKK